MNTADTISRRTAVGHPQQHGTHQLFEQDVSASMLFRERQERRAISPERALVYAVIEQAIYDLRDGEGAPAQAWQKRLAASDARAWFQSDSTLPFAFLWCCDVFGLDAEAIRAALLGGKRTAEPGETLTERTRGRPEGTCVQRARSVFAKLPAGTTMTPRSVREALGLGEADEARRLVSRALATLEIKGEIVRVGVAEYVRRPGGGA